MSNILKRLEALEAAGGSLSPTVSFLERRNDELWELSCGLWDGKGESRTRSTHRTEAEARAAYDSFLRRYPRQKQEPVLIIIDL